LNKTTNSAFISRKESSVTGKSSLPGIDFSKINKLKVFHNWNGTGKDLRDDLISLGGSSKFFRTKR
jgi:hypothetical protein